jgi:hypothetical protein
MRKWTPQELELYTLAELAHYLGRGTGKRARRWGRWLMKMRHHPTFGFRTAKALNARKVNGYWLIAIEDYLRWESETLVGVFKAVYAEPMIETLTRPTPLAQMFEANRAPNQGRYIQLQHVFGSPVQ